MEKFNNQESIKFFTEKLLINLIDFSLKNFNDRWIIICKYFENCINKKSIYINQNNSKTKDLDLKHFCNLIETISILKNLSFDINNPIFNNNKKNINIHKNKNILIISFIEIIAWIIISNRLPTNYIINIRIKTFFIKFAFWYNIINYENYISKSECENMKNNFNLFLHDPESYYNLINKVYIDTFIFYESILHI